MPTPVRRLLPALLGLALLGLAFLGTPTIEVNSGFDADGRQYGAMAGSDLFPPTFARQAPWAYRVLTPWLASLLPWDTLQSFRLLAVASGALSLALLFLILRRLELAPEYRLLGMLFYGLDFWTLRFPAYSPAYIDHQTAALLLVILLLTLSRRYLALLPVLVLAALQKESLSAFALVPAYALARERSHGLAAAVVLLPIATTLAIRRLVPVDNAYDAVSVVLQELSRWVHPRFWVVFAQATLTGLGVLPLVLAVRYQEWLRFLRANPLWVLYLAISFALLLGGTDKSRLYAYALPAVVVLALHALRGLRAVAEPRRFALWLCVAVGVHAFLGGWLTPLGTYEEYLARMVPEVAGERSVPYVVRNGAVALAFLALTPWLLFGEWRFERRAGFTRSSAAPSQ